MQDLEERIKAFFDAYQDRFNMSLSGHAADIRGTVNSFSKCFVEASPVGVNCGNNNFFFRWGIARGYSFYKKIGTVSMVILSKEISALNEFHSMAKIGWRSTNIRRTDHKEITIDFTVIYLLQHIDENDIRIFAYITGDEQKALKDHDLV
jgi:hypothetical protein